MSSYKHNIKHSDEDDDSSKNILLLELIEWFKAKNWTTDDFISYKDIKKEKELSILIHGVELNIEEIIQIIKDTNFTELNICVEYKTHEQVSWKTNTYFIYFNII